MNFNMYYTVSYMSNAILILMDSKYEEEVSCNGWLAIDHISLDQLTTYSQATESQNHHLKSHHINMNIAYVVRVSQLPWCFP